MKKIGLIVVVVALVALGNLSSYTLVVKAQRSASTAAMSAQRSSDSTPLPSVTAKTRTARYTPEGITSIFETVLPITESGSLLLMGGGLITIGLLFRRRIGS